MPTVTVNFTDMSTGDPLPDTWLWDFGDGTTSTEQNPSHEYAEEGYYTVVLTARNTIGAATKTIEVEAFCPDSPPDGSG